MRKIILYSGMGIMLIMFLMVFVTIHFRDTREAELVGLSEALDGTVRALYEKQTYEVGDSEQFAADLLQGLLDTLNSDSEVEVNILEADEEKGLLRVEAIQSYRHVNGKTGTVSLERTVLFDQPEKKEKEICHMYLYLTRADMEGEDGAYQNCYMVCTLLEGDALVRPEPSELEIDSWKLADGTQVDFTKMMEKDIYAYAFD